MTRNLVVVLAVLGLAVLLVPAPASAQWKAEAFAGYFIPEELDEDLAYGGRVGSKVSDFWGWEVAASWFDVADSQGFSGQKVDADVLHFDFSGLWYPGGGNFYVLGGIGWATGEVDAPNTTTKFSDDTFSVNGGVAYDFDFTETFYLRPDVRFRWYELEGFGPDGGKDNQITYEASVALGWRFGG